MNQQSIRKKVVYLIGAGASQGCVNFVGNGRGILMKHLTQKLADRVHCLVKGSFRDDNRLIDLVNTVVDEDTDFEHVITFLDESTSDQHRMFAERLRDVFEDVLRRELESIEEEIGEDRYRLYAMLLDMYEIQGLSEELNAILTINYDDYIEGAASTVYDSPVDFGISIGDGTNPNHRLKLLKLHGSFGWNETWPITTNGNASTLWIPPGIQKKKERYPFNVLWGLAREVLDCDVLRIVGCRLSPSDWDLISLLFTTRHSNTLRSPYKVEVIDSPCHAFRLKEEYPYLDIQSLLEIRDYEIGSRLIGELLGTPPKSYDSLSLNERERVLDAAGNESNWFRVWLEHMAEALFVEPTIESLDTESGLFNQLLTI